MQISNSVTSSKVKFSSPSQHEAKKLQNNDDSGFNFQYDPSTQNLARRAIVMLLEWSLVEQEDAVYPLVLGCSKIAESQLI